MIDILTDTLLDGIKILPFLFITYLIMEYLEHKTSNKTKKLVSKSGKFGPFIGGLLGVVPQCGFSAAASNLYAGRVITLGTLIAVYLSTSDEMLPIFISQSVPITFILQVLFMKLIIGMMAGFIIDLAHSAIVKHRKNKKEDDTEEAIEHICEDAHCDCEHDGILKSSIKHTLEIFAFILVITFAINCLVKIIGEKTLSDFIASIPALGILVSSLVGLIPNCAGSVIITELYLTGLISFGSMIAGLLTSAGIGLLVLFKSNKHVKENITILIMLYLLGVIFGGIIDLLI